MPVKYQPDLIYLRHVKTRRVHLFTLIQTVCFALIMVVKEITITSLAFPITVCARNSHVITVISNVPSVLWHCWLGARKSTRPVQIKS